MITIITLHHNKV